MGSNVTTSIPQGISERQWKKLDPTIRQACASNANFAAGIASALKQGRSIEQLNDFYKDSAVIQGLVVEKKDDGTIKPQPESTAALLGDKDFKEVTTAQWKAYFRERYNNNKDEAIHDMIRILCHKEVKQMQGTFADLWQKTDSSDPSERLAAIRLKLKYANDHPEVQKQVDKYAQAFIDKYKDKLGDPNKEIPTDPGLIGLYKQAFAPETQNKEIKSNTRDITLKNLTMDDLKALAQFKAINELGVDANGGYDVDFVSNACEEMAIEAVKDRNLNTAIVEVNDCKNQIKELRMKYRGDATIRDLTIKFNEEKAELQSQINAAKEPEQKKALLQKLQQLTAEYDQNCDAALPEDVQKEIKKLEEKMQKAASKASSKEGEFIEKNKEKLIELAALAQVQIDMQKHKYETTPPPQFTELDEDVQDLVRKNPALFCDEITDPNDTRIVVAEVAGKKYTFNPDTFKERMLEYSQAGRTSGDAQSNQEGCDYFCDLQEADRCFEGVVFGGLADGQKTKRDVIKKAMEAAGITTEADKTVQKRIAHVLKSAGIGALSGAGAVFVADFMATMRTCEFTEKIFELASLTKMIPFEATTRFQKDYHLEGDDATWHFENDYHLEGDDATWHFENDYHLSGDDATWRFENDYHLSGDDATWRFENDYHLSGDDATWNFENDYHLSGDDATWSGEAFWETSGTVDGTITVDHTHTDWQNGRPIGSQTWTDEKDVSLPYHDSGTTTVSGNNGHWETTHHVSESGNNGHWETTHHVSESGNNGHWETTHHVSESGNNGHWETTHHVSESGNNGHWETTHHVSESGNNGHWETTHHVDEEVTVEGEVENPDADRELYEQTGTKKRKFHPKFSSVATYAIAAGAGAFSGTIQGLFTMNKVRDEGLRRDAEVMRVVSQKHIRTPEPTTTPNPPAPPKQAETKQSSTIKIEDQTTPDRLENHSEIKTVPVQVAAPQKKGNKVYYQGWQTLQAAYNAPNTPEFRNWFRKEFLEGKDIWETGSKKDGPVTQHFEKEIVYEDKRHNKVYNLTFNPEIFAKALDYYIPDSNAGNAPTIGNTKPNISVNITHIPGSKTYSGTITVKIGDKTYTASAKGHTSVAALKSALKTELLKQGLSDIQIDKAIREAVTEEKTEKKE